MSIDELGAGVARVWGEAFLGPGRGGQVETWAAVYGGTERGPTLILTERLGPPVDLQLLQGRLPLEAGISLELQLQTDGGARFPLVHVAPGTYVAVEKVVDGYGAPIRMAEGEVTVAGVSWPVASAGVALPVERAIIRPLVG